MTSRIELGRLERVPLRDAWPGEATDFTPWVASPEGLKLIGKALNLELQTLSSSSEVHVGSFRADVVCVDTSDPDNSLVLIENQLGPADHAHIGQVLAYAAGLEAVTIIWIASEFRDEHSVAIEWLNRITHERYRFFGLEIELVKIGDSDPAATFSVVAKPNNWSRGVRRRTDPDLAYSDLDRYHEDFWTALCSHVIERNIDVRVGNPRPQRWMGVPFGPQGAWLNAVRLVQPPSLRVEAHFRAPFPSEYFVALHHEKAAIEKELEFAVEWDPRPTTSRIFVTTSRDPQDVDDWPAQIEWFVDKLQRFDRAFRNRVNTIDPADWSP